MADNVLTISVEFITVALTMLVLALAGYIEWFDANIPVVILLHAEELSQSDQKWHFLQPCACVKPKQSGTPPPPPNKHCARAFVDAFQCHIQQETRPLNENKERTTLTKHATQTKISMNVGLDSLPRKGSCYQILEDSKGPRTQMIGL